MKRVILIILLAAMAAYAQQNEPESKPVAQKDADALTQLAQQSERLRYHYEQLDAAASKAKQDWLNSSRDFELYKLKLKSDMGLAGEWTLKRLDDGKLTFVKEKPNATNPENAPK